jgi:hypothetical protein
MLYCISVYVFVISFISVLMASDYLQMGDMLLPQLMEGDCSKRICVRVARFWELYNPQDESRLLHTNMVLVDEEVRTIP